MTNKPTPASQQSPAPEGLAKQFGYPAIEQPSPARSDSMEAKRVWPQRRWLSRAAQASAGGAQERQCWSCKRGYTDEQRADADGNCPHCGVEIEMSAESAPSGEHGNTDHVGRDMDSIEQPFAGAIVLLETIAECGAIAYIDGQRTQNSELCRRFAAELRTEARRATAGTTAPDLAARIISSEKPLDAESHRLFNENRWDMYVGDESGAAGTTAAPSDWPAQVPQNVFYSVEHDNFYSADNEGMGQGFYELWAERKDLFPIWTSERATAGNAAPTDAGELIELLRAIRPKFGAVGSRDVDVRAQQERIDRAIEILATPAAAPGDLPKLPEQHEELRARWKCESCDGRGHDGEAHYQGEFQPPEPYPCGDCNGAGCIQIEAYTDDQMREYGKACIASNAGEAPGQYRLLDTRDIIEATDEWLAGDAVTWSVNPYRLFDGHAYCDAMLPARRRLAAPSSTSQDKQEKE